MNVTATIEPLKSKEQQHPTRKHSSLTKSIVAFTGGSLTQAETSLWATPHSALSALTPTYFCYNTARDFDKLPILMTQYDFCLSLPTLPCFPCLF